MTTPQTETAQKTCKFGGEPLPDDNHVTYYVVDKKTGETTSETYGCREHDLEQRVKEYLDTGNIVTSLWTEAAILVERAKYDKAEAPLWAQTLVLAMEPVTVMGKEWERVVWFGGGKPHEDDSMSMPYPGLGLPDKAYREGIQGIEGSLQAFVRPAEWKGYSAEVDGLEYLSYTMCGRSVFQINDKETGSYVSMIMDEDSPSPRGGIRSINATPAEAIALFTKAIQHWQAGMINLVHGEGVGFGF
jgi:hypothetical protein